MGSKAPNGEDPTAADADADAAAPVVSTGDSAPLELTAVCHDVEREEEGEAEEEDVCASSVGVPLRVLFCEVR